MDPPQAKRRRLDTDYTYALGLYNLDNIFFIFSTTTDNNTNISKLPY